MTTTNDERQLVVRWRDPAPAAAKVGVMSGVAYLTAIMKGELPQVPIASTLGLRLTVVEAGRVVVAGRPGEQYYNPLGAVHGGYLSTMLDSAMACAVHSALEAGVGYTTLSLQVSFVKAVRAGAPSCLPRGAWSTTASATPPPTERCATPTATYTLTRRRPASSCAEQADVRGRSGNRARRHSAARRPVGARFSPVLTPPATCTEKFVMATGYRSGLRTTRTKPLILGP